MPISRSTTPNSGPSPGTSQDGSTAQLDVEQSSHSIVNRVASLFKSSLDRNLAGIEVNSRKGQAGYWSLEPEYRMSADFGQALFSLRLSDRNKVVEAVADPSVTPFQPSIPGLGSLLASSEMENISRSDTPALLYDFLPAPDQKNLDTTIGPDFPRLHIQVRTGGDGSRPIIHKLSLGFHERIHDVLLPDQSADIRFHQYGRLRFSIRSHHDNNVEKWLEAVRQNIESGGRLSAPSLTIGIPKWTIPGFPSDATDTVNVKYLFSGIQFRQLVTGRMLDTQVSYSTMQSGKLGAKVGAFSAYSDKVKGNGVESQIRDFAAKCLHMVDYITQASARTQPPKQIVSPRNEYSGRKMRRLALHGGSAGVSSQEEHEENHDLGQDESDAVDLESQDDTDFHADQDTDARLSSRLDDAAPTPETEADTALDEAYEAAEADRQDAKNKAQQQEADALLDDLFSDAPVGEATGEEQSEVDSAKESKTL